MELRTYLGRKPDSIKLETDKNGKFKPNTNFPPNLKLETPIIFAPMSYGAVSLNVHRSLVMAAKEAGTFMNTGEGGLHKDLYPYGDHIIVQCASGRFGVHSEYLNAGSAVEIKVGHFLPLWRPNADYRKSYRSKRWLGGGVDLELSHEIDYCLWLFGDKYKKSQIFRKKS